MITHRASVCIDAPTPTVWAHLARLEEIALWSEPIIAARCEGPRTRGVGAERTCTLRGNLTVRERWVAWDEGHSFTYEGFGVPLMRRATNRWSVHAQGEQTLLTSAAELELKGGPLGRMVEPVVGLLLRRTAPTALAAFKYFVEHGHPCAGKAADLPRAPATC
jgi:hypothetical protein